MFVLYSGKEPWNGATSLHEMLDFTDIPEQLRDMTSDYRINVIEIRKLKHTEVFRTDVRQVFDFIRCSEDKKQLQELVEREVYYQYMEEDIVERKVSTVRRGIILGRISGSRNFMCILLKGFLSIISLYSR